MKKLILLLSIIAISCSKEDEIRCVTVTIEGKEYNIGVNDTFDKEDYEAKATPEQASIQEQNSPCG